MVITQKISIKKEDLGLNKAQWILEHTLPLYCVDCEEQILNMGYLCRMRNVILCEKCENKTDSYKTCFVNKYFVNKNNLGNSHEHFKVWLKKVKFDDD